MVANSSKGSRQLTPAQQLWAHIFASLPPIPALKVSEWSSKHRYLSSESSSKPGKYTCFEYQREPMDAPLESDVVETIYWWAAQTGKSENLNNTVGYFMHADPSTILLVQPTIELVEAYSLERIAPMIRDTPPLRRIVREAKSRDAGNKTKFKRYPGGNLAMVGANAPAGLAGRPRRVVVQDEIDRFPDSAGTEGDPCALADKRTESFPNAIKVKTSTATVKGRSKIEKAFERSDKRKWHVRCQNPRCAHEFVMMWEHVIWEEDKPETGWIECPKCHKHHTDQERIAMVRYGVPNIRVFFENDPRFLAQF